MADTTVRIDSGIREIAIENQKGELVTTLRINTQDSRVMERFATLVQNLSEISTEAQAEEDRLKEKYGKEFKDANVEEDMDQIVEVSKANIDYLEKCANEIDALFGDGTIKSVFRECYEINPDYVPDDMALNQFIDGVIPVMNDLFKTRFDATRTRYNAGKRGKQTKAK